MDLQKDVTEPETCPFHASQVMPTQTQALRLWLQRGSPVCSVPALPLAGCYSHESLTRPEHLCNIQTSNRQLDSPKPHVHDLSQGHVISLEEHPQSAWFCVPALLLTAKVTWEGADSSVPQFFSQ